MNEHDLTATKPAQAAMDTAQKVLWWLYAHTRLFPEDWPETIGISASTPDILVGVANLCGMDVDMLPTTDAEYRKQGAWNQHITEEETG